MQEAYRNARRTFRYLWRELSWERRRIVPALGMACIKAPFGDGPVEQWKADAVEHMWVSDFDFDGHRITGTLLNRPNTLQSIQEGDTCIIPFERLTDWMYSIDGRVYGAFTVNVIRSQMSVRERRSHDSAWGLDFGDPNEIKIAPSKNAEAAKPAGFLDRLLGKKSTTTTITEPAEDEEHPMSVNMADSFRNHLENNPEVIQQSDDRGWTLLHAEALAGNTAQVAILLEHGADPTCKTKSGDTAFDLANRMQWKAVMTLLSK